MPPGAIITLQAIQHTFLDVLFLALQVRLVGHFIGNRQHVAIHVITGRLHCEMVIQYIRQIFVNLLNVLCHLLTGFIGYWVDLSFGNRFLVCLYLFVTTLVHDAIKSSTSSNQCYSNRSNQPILLLAWCIGIISVAHFIGGGIISSDGLAGLRPRHRRNISLGNGGTVLAKLPFLEWRNIIDRTILLKNVSHLGRAIRFVHWSQVLGHRFEILLTILHQFSIALVNGEHITGLITAAITIQEEFLDDNVNVGFELAVGAIDNQLASCAITDNSVILHQGVHYSIFSILELCSLSKFHCSNIFNLQRYNENDNKQNKTCKNHIKTPNISPLRGCC